MKIEKYALLDTDFISKTHFIHGDTEKCLDIAFFVTAKSSKS